MLIFFQVTLDMKISWSLISSYAEKCCYFPPWLKPCFKSFGWPRINGWLITYLGECFFSILQLPEFSLKPLDLLFPLPTLYTWAWNISGEHNTDVANRITGHITILCSVSVCIRDAKAIYHKALLIYLWWCWASLLYHQSHTRIAQGCRYAQWQSAAFDSQKHTKVCDIW